LKLSDESFERLTRSRVPKSWSEINPSDSTIFISTRAHSLCSGGGGLRTVEQILVVWFLEVARFGAWAQRVSIASQGLGRVREGALRLQSCLGATKWRI
jgi:hypothetical protein